MLISVYTDGSCDPQTQAGSFGYVITAKHKGKNVLRCFSSDKYLDTTNNRMELKSIIKALESIEPGHTIDLYSDSQYCINSINQWLQGWVESGKLHTKQNPDLWERFIEIKQKHFLGKTHINFTWVRGHNGNEFNEMADKLALKGRISIGNSVVVCKKNN